MPYLDDPAVFREAGNACAKIAENLLYGKTVTGKIGPELVAGLEKTIQVAPDEELARRAKSFLKASKERLQHRSF